MSWPPRSSSAARRTLDEQDESRSQWRFVPLGLAISLTLLVVLTQGGGIIVTPIASALTVVAFRRVHPRSLALLVGGVVVAFYTLLFVWTIGLIAYDVLA
jgi:hypothetical protein